MRIRRRPPLPLPSTTILLDPSPPLQEESKILAQVHEQRDHGLLHQDGDLLHLDVGKSLPNSGSNPSPTHLPSCCISPPITTHVQVLKEEEKGEEEMGDWSKRCEEEEQVNSNMSNIDGCDGESEKKTIVLKKDEANMRAKAGGAPTDHQGCTSVDGDDDEGKKKKKRRRSPAVLMEGSRCSRVNGRGWRCCQQTLVGYSLCEHHLGKGRLRSVTSVRGQLGCTTKKGGVVDDGPSSTAEGDEAVNCRRKRKKKKIVTVKARSISSLLDESDNSPSESLSSPLPPPEDGVDATIQR